MQTTGNLNLKKPDGTDIVDIDDLNDNMDILDMEITKKVDKVTGKQLSTEDYTSAEKTKLAGIVAGANKYSHPATHPANMITPDSTHRFVTDAEKSSWNSKAAGVHTHTKSQITDFPSSLPANGGNSDTVDGKHASGTLVTSEKSNLVAAINEVFTDVDNGKDTIASAITDMGQGAAGSDSFVTLGNKIKDISSDATAAEGNVLSGKTFYKGSKRTGTMPNRGTVSGSITTQGGQFTIPSGYYSGSGKVTASFANLIASNVKNGVNIGGVVGSLIEGKRWASGSARSIPINSRVNYVQTSGLNFIPSIVYVYYKASFLVEFTIYIIDIDLQQSSTPNYFYGVFAKPGYGWNNEFITKNFGENLGVMFYVDSSGFCLEVYEPDTLYNWIAIE